MKKKKLLFLLPIGTCFLAIATRCEGTMAAFLYAGAILCAGLYLILDNLYKIRK